MYICNIKALVYINNDMFILKIYVYIYIHIIFTQMKLLPSNTGRCIYICMKQVKSGLKQVYIYIYMCSTIQPSSFPEVHFAKG